MWLIRCTMIPRIDHEARINRSNRPWIKPMSEEWGIEVHGTGEGSRRSPTGWGYWRAKAAAASLARSTKGVPLTSMITRAIVPPVKAQGRWPG
jgi:hypothetical protein